MKNLLIELKKTYSSILKITLFGFIILFSFWSTEARSDYWYDQDWEFEYDNSCQELKNPYSEYEEEWHYAW